MNPPIGKLAIVVLTSFMLLWGAVAVVQKRTGSDVIAVVAALWWVVLSTFGRLLRGVDNGALRIACVVVVLVLIALAVRAFRKQFASWIFLASLFSIAVTFGQMAFTSLNNPDPLTDEATGVTMGGASAGSFYLIVVDGYGAPGERSEGISQFSSALEGRGFTVMEEPLANYVYTHAAISNLLSLDHKFKYGSTPVSAMFNAIQGASRMRSVFEAAGYRYVHFEGGWSGSRCGPTVDNCVKGAFIDSFVWQAIQMSIFTNLVEKNVAHPYVAGGLSSLDALVEHGRFNDSGRDFVFAHLVLPHPPLQLDSECNLVIDPRLAGQLLGVQGMNAATRDFREDGFRQQRACLNERLLSLISDLPASTNIVITADHGTDFRGQMEKEPKDWSPADIKERFEIFHAARLPDSCETSSERDLVNLIRAEVACLTGEPLTPIDPYHEITPYFTTDFDVRVLTGKEVP
jgi:hypothetical protein